MKHVSEFILEISRNQLAFQSRLDDLAKKFASLERSSDINTIATLPLLEADLCALNSLNQRINSSINASM